MLHLITCHGCMMPPLVELVLYTVTVSKMELFNLNIGTTNQLTILLLKPASVAQLNAPSDWRPGGRGFNPRRGRQHSFVDMSKNCWINGEMCKTCG